MSTEPIENLLDEALQIENEGERKVYLDRACGGDQNLRRKIDDLLKKHLRAAEFFDGLDADMDSSTRDFQKTKAGGDASADQTHSELNPSGIEGIEKSIGPFKLLQVIGEGGMGLVYMAEQTEPVRRKVALKIIKAGMDSKQVIARFEAERQALAMMDHPNIARVLDGGVTDTGQPYFAMELVHGVPITTFCNKNKLSAQERIELFLPVCRAIQSAHQKGIIHRDIKPSNVMVSLHYGEPIPKVIDFGIAKAINQNLTEKTLFTNYGQLVGTPAYMSPEQAEMSTMDIDTRSDVYSLGVLLYELLTGSTPFPEKQLRSVGYAEMQRIISEEEPPRPSLRMSTLQGKEKSIIAKSHGTEASVLATSLKGDLDWIAMKCLAKDRRQRYDTPGELLADLKRHINHEPISAGAPTLTYQLLKLYQRHRVLARAGLFAAMVLIVATVVSSWLAIEATQARTMASERLTASEQARAESDAIAEFMLGVFQSPTPGQNGRAINAGDMLDAAKTRLENKFIEQPEIRLKLQTTLARTYFGLDLLNDAIGLQRQIVHATKEQFGSSGSQTLNAMTQLAKYSTSNDESIRLYQEVFNARKMTLGPRHPITLQAHLNLTKALAGFEQFEEAEKLAEKGLALSREALGPKHTLTLNFQASLASTLSRGGQHELAITHYEEILSALRNSTEPKIARTRSITHALASTYMFASRFDRAIELFNDNVTSARQEFGEDSKGTIDSIQILARAHAEAGNDQRALELWQKAAGATPRIYGEGHSHTLRTKFELAKALLTVGKHPQGMVTLESLANAEIVHQRNEEVLVFAPLMLASVYAWNEDQTNYERTVNQWLERASQSTSPLVAERVTRLASFRGLSSSQDREALKALALRGITMKTSTRWSQLALGMAEYRSGDLDAAKQALTLVSEAPPTTWVQFDHVGGTALSFRAMIAMDEGNPTQALSLLNEAMPLMRPMPTDPKNPLEGASNHNDLMVWLAYREAESLISTARQPSASDPQKEGRFRNQEKDVH